MSERPRIPGTSSRYVPSRVLSPSQYSTDQRFLPQDRGIDALVNDSLINNVWTFFSYAVGALCCAFAFIYLQVSNPSYIQNDPNLKAVVMGYAFAIGFFVCHTLGYGALSSGSSPPHSLFLYDD
jgi:hypothetical protein